MLSFYIKERPMNGFLHNLVQVFNEFSVMCLVVSLVTLTDYEPNPVVRYENGYKFENAVYAIFAVNIVILLLIIANTIYK